MCRQPCASGSSASAMYLCSVAGAALPGLPEHGRRPVLGGGLVASHCGCRYTEERPSLRAAGAEQLPLEPPVAWRLSRQAMSTSFEPAVTRYHEPATSSSDPHIHLPVSGWKIIKTARFLHPHEAGCMRRLRLTAG